MQADADTGADTDADADADAENRHGRRGIIQKQNM